MPSQAALDIILGEFMNISQVPRPSHHEERISQYLFQWAKEHNLSVVCDDLGEVIIDKPASPGCEKAPRVILQAHMDMVCVAEEGVAFDPLNDPIKVVNDGKTLTAEGTSLGADDGIGIAMCLYLLQDDKLKHGPLRCIFTVNEEDGMASCDLDAKYLDGAYLINLDWETLGSVCISAAGGDFFDFICPADWSKPQGRGILYEIELSGLQGGHSGVGINKGHANALVSIGTALELLRQSGIAFRIADFCGGQAKNAIAAQAKAAIVVSESELSRVRELLETFAKELQDGFRNVEPDMKLSYGPAEGQAERVLSEAAGYGLVKLISALPADVHTMSPFVEGLVESSANMGLVTISDTEVDVNLFTRSSSPYRATQLSIICQAMADMSGYNLVLGGHAPAWAVNPNSKLTAIACQEYKKLTGTDMVVEPVHAGLECGAFAEKNPDLDMIAIGPTLLDVHSPNESCNIQDVRITNDLLVAILERLA